MVHTRDGRRIRKKRGKPVYIEVCLRTRRANEKALGIFFDRDTADLFAEWLRTEHDLGTDSIVIQEIC